MQLLYATGMSYTFFDFYISNSTVVRFRTTLTLFRTGIWDLTPYYIFVHYF